MSQTNDLLSQLRENPRLRWGIALIIGTAWLYGVLVLRDELRDQTQRYRSAVQSVARLNTQLAEPEWIERTTAARALAVQMEARLWQAPTSGLAQAALQDWLRNTLAQSGVMNPQITVTVIEDSSSTNANPAALAPSPDLANAIVPADLLKLKAKLSFELNPTTLLDLLARFENHDKQLVVKQLTARKEPNPRVEMEVIAYFQKPAKAAGAL